MQLRDYQIEALNALWQYWKSNTAGVPLIVSPTGSGKSLLCAKTIETIITKKPHYRILCVTHRKEIIEQNAKELQALLPAEPIGIYSASLGLRQIKRITFANIQSIYKKDLPPIHLVIVDECHLIPKAADSMYQKFFRSIFKAHYNAKIVGLTATPFRLDQGSLLSEGGLFTDIVYDISIKKLIADGHLANLISKASTDKVDLSNISKSGYDYNQGELQATYTPLIERHCDEIIAKGADRKHWLIFCSGIDHAEMVAECLRSKGIPANSVNGELMPMDRDRRINEFKSGKVRALTNCDILTTGFNFKPIDLLVILRATKSAALYIQIVGRGMRPAEGKANCLLLDFGGNIGRHGPIDLVSFKVEKEKKKIKIEVSPFKECPECGATVGARTLECSCGYIFPPPKNELDEKASEASVLSEDEIWWEVKEQGYKIHRKIDKPPSFKIEYYCSGRKWVAEYLCLAHKGLARTKAGFLWLARGGKSPPPLDAEEAMERKHELTLWDELKVVQDGKYPRIAAARKNPNSIQIVEQMVDPDEVDVLLDRANL